MNRLRIGLLGGTFDPIHRAHIALALAACAAFNLAEVRFMPCAQQALKARHPASAAARTALLRLALAPHPGLTLDTRELYRPGKTYTYDTLCELRRTEPQADFFFIFGMDSVCDFPRWHRARELLTLCHFIAFDRPGIAPPEQPFSPKLLAHRLTGPGIDLSSTALREAIGRADWVAAEKMLPPGLLPYLRRHALYTLA